MAVTDLTYHIESITSPDAAVLEEWNDFVVNVPKGTVFQGSAMFKLYFHVEGHHPFLLVLRGQSGQIEGGCLAVRMSNGKGLMARFSERVLIIGGPLISQSDSSAGRLLIQQLKQLCRKTAVYIEFRPIDTFIEDDLFKLNEFKYEDHLNILLDATNGTEPIWKNLSASRRNGISKSKRRGVVCRSINNHDFAQAYQILKNHYQHIGVPMPSQSYFAYIHDVMNPAGDAIVMGAYQNDTLIGALFALIDNRAVYNHYVASDYATFHLKPNDLLIWSGIEEAVKRGCKYFDFMGAGKPQKKYGVRDFKLRFGGEMYHPGRYLWISKPHIYYMGVLALKMLNVLKPLKRLVFKD